MIDNHQWIFKIVVYVFMVLIVLSLGSSLFFILFRKGKSEEAVKALTVRIGLSLTLFILLFIAFGMGWLKPHPLFPITSKQTQTEITIPHRQNANTMPQPQNQNGAQE